MIEADGHGKELHSPSMVHVAQVCGVCVVCMVRAVAWYASEVCACSEETAKKGRRDAWSKATIEDVVLLFAHQTIAGNKQEIHADARIEKAECPTR